MRIVLYIVLFLKNISNLSFFARDNIQIEYSSFNFESLIDEDFMRTTVSFIEILNF